MIRRAPARLAVIAAAAVALSGCATFSDADVAVRVEDDEMSEDQLAEMLREALGDDEATIAPMDVTNQILTNFVLDRSLRYDLAALGETVPEVDGADTSYAALEQSANEAFTAWQTITPEPPPDEVLRATYAEGPAQSNIACTRHILVDDEATADEVLERLDDGDDFAELAAEYSIDPGSAETGGVIPCETTSTFASSYIQEFVAAVVDAEVGVPVGPIESEFGFHIIEVREFDDLAEGELDAVIAQLPMRFEFATAGLDIYVDPRYGTFEGARGIVPLG